MNKKYGIVTSISLLVFAAAAVTAAPPTSYYLPLETNDPTCAPGDLNCDVDLGLPSTADVANWNTAYSWGDHASVGYLTTEVDGDITNEIQDLSLSGSTLSLSGSAGTPIDLSGLSGMDTDDQTLSLSGVTLSIVDGNDTDLSPAITSLQPWFGTDDNAGATLNTEDIYTMGSVIIGETAPIAQLTVNSGVDDAIAKFTTTDNVGDFGIQGSVSGGGAYYFNTSFGPEGRMVFNETNGNIGIGGDWTPPARFSVTSTTAGVDRFRVGDGGNGANTQFIVDENGDVGIGMNDPTETFDVDGTARVRTLGTGTGSDSLVTADSTGVLRQLPISSIAGMGSPWFGTDDNMSATLNTENMYTMGDIGIKTTGKFGGSNDVISILDNIGAAYGIGDRFLNFYSHTAGIRSQLATDDSSAQIVLRHGSTGDMNITPAVLAGVQQNSIFTAGNVGVGTTNPQSKLSVVGLPSGTTDAVTPGALAGAVCITDAGNMYIDTDGTCAN